MKILVMSDTHSNIETMEQVIQRHLDVDAIIHCGDSELDYTYFENSTINVVRGNCDFDFNYPIELIISIGDETIYVTHGHLYNVKSTLMPLSYRAAEAQASIVCFGHSHLLGAEMYNNVLYVNPGSLHMPRGRKEKSYAMIEKFEYEWNVSFFSPENELLESVRFNAKIQ